MFNWLRKKIEKEEYSESFSSLLLKLREELSLQKKTLSDLHSGHHSFKSSSYVNNQRISEWITHFDNSIKKIEKDVVLLEKRLSTELDKAKSFEEKYLLAIKNATKEEVTLLRKELLHELEVFRSKNELKTDIINVNNVDNVNSITTDPSFEALSNPEKWLMGVLFNSEQPLSYAQLVEKTGKSVSTLRVYMNQLKFKGFVEESALPNGVKIFGLKHRAKVKKLYNF